MASPCKHIVIGITGGIAAYKSLTLIRLFKKVNCEVKVIATRNALEFVTPLTIETLSQQSLYTDTFAPHVTWDVQHVSLADWADCVIIAPATANLIGKYANGIADDALTTFLLAYNNKPLFVAPAMNDKMYAHPAVQQNLDVLKKWGCHIIEPDAGLLACGTEGKGRMEEPEEIFRTVTQYFESQNRFAGKKVLVTAGPTYEPIDPVRFIGNHSSGIMGFSIADAFASQGADVTLIAGPTSCQTHSSQVSRKDVTTAQEMYEATTQNAPDADIIIMAAAVADYTPKEVAPEKIKKTESDFSIALSKTKDILAEVGKAKRNEQLLVGFALETENELENAKKKLKNKNLDFIVLNSLKTPGAGFKTATNQVTVINRDGEIKEFPLKDKKAVAEDIADVIYNTMKI